MSNEIQVVAEAELNLYFIIRNVSGQVWFPAGQAFEIYGTGGRDADDYDISLTDKSVGLYVGDFDSNITTEGKYLIVVYKRLGSSPADTDLVMGTNIILWNGKSEFDPVVVEKASYLRANKAKQNKLTGTITYYDIDGSTALYTETETDNGDGTVTVEVAAA
ncbi:hypothetical protein ACFL02_07450 [Planctomycetota bacterium]